jgi:putative membrane protein (TIGR04086 family)
MNLIKDKLRTFFSFLIILSIFGLIYALLIWANKIDGSGAKFHNVTFVTGIALFVILGLLSGYYSQEKGLLAGLSSALILIVVILLINIFVHEPFTFRMFLKFITYMTGSAFGGIVGVNIPRLKR